MNPEEITVTKELFDAMVDCLYDLPRRDTVELFVRLSEELNPVTHASPIIIN